MALRDDYDNLSLSISQQEADMATPQPSMPLVLDELLNEESPYTTSNNAQALSGFSTLSNEARYRANHSTVNSYSALTIGHGPDMNGARYPSIVDNLASIPYTYRDPGEEVPSRLRQNGCPERPDANEHSSWEHRQLALTSQSQQDPQAQTQNPLSNKLSHDRTSDGYRNSQPHPDFVSQNGQSYANSVSMNDQLQSNNTPINHAQHQVQYPQQPLAHPSPPTLADGMSKKPQRYRSKNSTSKDDYDYLKNEAKRLPRGTGENLSDRERLLIIRLTPAEQHLRASKVWNPRGTAYAKYKYLSRNYVSGRLLEEVKLPRGRVPLFPGEKEGKPQDRSLSSPYPIVSSTRVRNRTARFRTPHYAQAQEHGVESRTEADPGSTPGDLPSQGGRTYEQMSPQGHYASINDPQHGVPFSNSIESNRLQLDGNYPSSDTSSYQAMSPGVASRNSSHWTSVPADVNTRITGLKTTNHERWNDEAMYNEQEQEGGLQSEQQTTSRQVPNQVLASSSNSYRLPSFDHLAHSTAASNAPVNKSSIKPAFSSIDPLFTHHNSLNEEQEAEQRLTRFQVLEPVQDLYLMHQAPSHSDNTSIVAALHTSSSRSFSPSAQADSQSDMVNEEQKPAQDWRLSQDVQRLQALDQMHSMRTSSVSPPVDDQTYPGAALQPQVVGQSRSDLQQIDNRPLLPVAERAVLSVHQINERNFITQGGYSLDEFQRTRQALLTGELQWEDLWYKRPPWNQKYEDPCGGYVSVDSSFWG